MEHTNTARNIALLAPVPSAHLDSAKKAVESTGRAAFGSMKRELFRELDRLRKGMPVDVFIYASRPSCDDYRGVSWRARYVGHVENEMAVAHHRPESTFNDTPGSAVFWLVDKLWRLDHEGRMTFSEFTAFGKNKAYVEELALHGPLLIEHPL